MAGRLCMFPWIVLLAASIAFLAPVSAQVAPMEDAGVGFYATAYWDSTYVSQGREYLSDGTLLAGEAGTEWGGFCAYIWYAAGDTEDLEELDICLSYTHEFGGYEFTLDYTRLEYLSDDAGDNWFSGGLAYSSFPWLIPKILVLHSTEADGQYAAAMLSSDLALFNERLTVSPYVLEGFDFGFATAEYDGPNHLEIGLEAALTLTEMLEFGAHINHLWPHRDEKNEGLEQVTWGGANLTVSF